MPAFNSPQSSCLNSSANSYASLWDLRIQQACNCRDLRVQQACKCRDLRVEQACKVGVEALISADELIGEGEAVHEATLLQPEDAAETAQQCTLSARDHIIMMIWIK